jgi:succinyl-diaminopimelate desuccinylase
MVRSCPIAFLKEIVYQHAMTALNYTTQLMSIPSVTPKSEADAPAISATLDLLESWLKPMGFACHRIKSGHVDNLYARFGTASPHISFAGHVDVVPPGDLSTWVSPPFAPEVREGMLYGRGAVDMKGAIGSFMAALERYLGDVPSPNGSISVLITGDEEGPATDGTVKVLDWLRAHHEQIDGCIVGEPTNPMKLGEMIKHGRRGSETFWLTVEGVQGHVAYPQLAKNPISSLVKMLSALETYKLDDGTEFFDPSNLVLTSVDVGNPTANVIPGAAKAQFNIRFNDMHTADSLKQWVIKSIESAAPGVTYELKARCSAQPFITPPGKLSDLLTQAIIDTLGVVPELSTTGGTSDARFIKDICPVIEFGLINQTAHKANEHVSVQALEDLASIYVAFLSAWFEPSEHKAHDEL